MRDYTKYDVWKKSHELTLFVYMEVLPHFPKHEQFELASQLRRAVCSIPLNIVEGCGRNTDKDFVRFLDISPGSTNESEYCMLLAKDLGYINESLFVSGKEKINIVRAKLINLIKSIRL